MAENVVFCHIYFTTIQKNTQKTQTGEKGWAERKTQFSPRPRSSRGALASRLPGEATLIKSIHTTQALPGVVLFNRNYSLQGARSGLLPACLSRDLPISSDLLCGPSWSWQGRGAAGQDDPGHTATPDRLPMGLGHPAGTGGRPVRRLPPPPAPDAQGSLQTGPC